MNWVALERVSGGSALPTIWRRALGLGYSADEEAEFRAFVELFFKARPDSPAGSVPCPWDCGCMHRVERGPNGALLEGAGSAMFSVEGTVGIEGGKLVGKVEPEKLFEEVFPSADLAVPDEEMARRVFVTLQQDEAERSRRSRRKGPSLYAVFDLY